MERRLRLDRPDEAVGVGGDHLGRLNDRNGLGGHGCSADELLLLRHFGLAEMLLNLFCFVRLRYFFYLHYQYSKLRLNLSNV